MRNTFKILIISILLSSCGKEYKMKNQFEEEFKKTMNDPNSFELVDFIIVKEAFSYSEKNRKHLDSIHQSNQNYDNYSKHHDSIIKIEEKIDPNFHYTQVLAKVRGNNLYGAKVLKTHTVLYSDLLDKPKLHSIDGRLIH